LEEHAASKENQHFPSDVIFAVFFVSKEHTKLFKDSNMNIIKAIFDLFTVVLSIHVSWKRQPDKSFCSDSISLAIDKVGDKKFYENSCTLLYSLCEVCPPETILTDLIAAIDGIKAPLPRELLLQWCTGFFQSFGVKAAGNCIPIVARWIIKVTMRIFFLKNEKSSYNRIVYLTPNICFCKRKSRDQTKRSARQLSIWHLSYIHSLDQLSKE
jgi:hypothetical protein